MISLNKVARKSGDGTQYAALCYRQRSGKGVEILLITSRGTGRWIPPKGWPIAGLAPNLAAAQEAMEEAGVTGKIADRALGRYRYHRAPAETLKKSSEAYIFPLRVTGRLHEFKEKGQRRIKWFDQKTAALMVREPKLARLIRAFCPPPCPPANPSPEGS